MQASEYLKLAYQFAAEHSDDPRTQTGAIIVNKDGIIIGRGANRIPPGVQVLDERKSPEQKPNFIGHAERNAVADAARQGHKTEGAILYGFWAACAVCAQAIIEAGIKEGVVHKQIMDKTPPKWQASISIAMLMFAEAGISVVYHDEDKLGVKILFDGQTVEF